MCVCMCMCVYVYACMCVCVCVSPPPRQLTTSSVIWTPYDWLHKLYNYCIASVGDFIGLSINAHCGNLISGN